MNITLGIVILYFGALLLIGWLGNRSSKKSHELNSTTWQEEFYTGAKKMNPIVLGCTFAATIASGGIFMGHPGLGYTRGLTWSWAYMCAIWTGILPFILLGKRVFRVGMKIRAVSPSDVIEYRYENNKPVSIIMIVLTIFFYMSYTTSQFAAGGRMLAFITGLDYIWALIIFAVIIVVYVTAAGMRGVAWTDTLQGILMLVVGISIVPTIIAYAGGMENITATLAEIDPMMLRGGEGGTATAFGVMISFMFLVNGLLGLGQPAGVQRLLVYDNPKTFKWGAVIAGFMVMFMSASMVLAGVMGRAIFPDLEVADNIIPTLIAAIMPKILAAIFLSGILAAINSSANSYMLCVSASIVKDLIADFIKPDIKDSTVSKLTTIVTLMVGGVSMVLAIKPPAFIGLMILYAWKGLGLCIGIPLVFGCLWKRANKYGALASIVVAMVSYMLIDKLFGSTFLGLDLDSSAWGLIFGAAAMIVVSLATPKTKQEVLDTFFDEEAVEAAQLQTAPATTDKV